ncbi:dihydroorotase [Thermomicrobiaceae bacterium CFH 74404]|uniref:Dihydroorotase n=1 Tax=Thermalbibacter longus TaxID=2951981 RepID=A0AA41WAP8_9BACT|nr:dihydroorotase [Thermalbibacter longus]MCM8748946.1 dihydroorotase [Thermalbibacter longus]
MRGPENPGIVIECGARPLGSGRTQRLFSWAQSPALLIRGGRVVDPSQGLDQTADLLVIDGRVAGIGTELAAPHGTAVFDARDLVVAPGLVDVHVHLRDPGFPEKETLETGAVAAATGGFTAICCMPNTEPPLDTPERVADVITRSRGLPVRVYPIGAISRGRQGLELADLGGMAEAGAIGFSDDGDSTRDSRVMRAALAWSARSGRPIMAHCEDRALAAGGVMHEGAVSRELGLPGIPAAAEEIILLRDLELARLTGGWLHVLHLTTARGRRLVRAAKLEGVRVTAEVMPHHLLLTDEWVAGRRRFVGEDRVFTGPCPDPHAKVNPPLRTEADARDLLAGLRDGTIDIIATDHAPHSERDKPDDLTRAAFGMIGLELALPLMLRLVARGELSLPELIDVLSTRPAALFGLPGGTLRPGSPADVVVFDPEATWQVERATLASRSCNTPLLGMELHGQAVLTMVDGKVVYVDTDAVAWRAGP